MSEVKLNLINRSDMLQPFDVVIWQRNTADDTGYGCVAWRVVRDFGHLSNHPFVVPDLFEVCAMDNWRSYTPRLASFPGQAFEMVDAPSGYVLQPADTPAASPNEVEIRNKLTQGEIDAQIYKDGKLLAQRGALTPGQKAAFAVLPAIFIGVVGGIKEGVLMDAGVISQVSTEISILGLRSADIVMTGGGGGPEAEPIDFTVENVTQ